MYLDYFGLHEPPFDLTPNPRFLYFSAKHREALNHLLYGIRERKGFVQLTGEVGAGKTTICRALLDELGKPYATALILNPRVAAAQLHEAIAREFGLRKLDGLDRLQMLARLNRHLLRLVREQRVAVLVIDEAQDLTDDLLEEVRLLSNLETDDRKLLQIVLLGQPELRTRLNQHSMRQLRQRITVRYHLQPLRFGEVLEYLRHRLTVAQAGWMPHFTAPALWRLHRYSGGIPRLLNAVADKCLLAAFVRKARRVDCAMVGLAIRELEGKINA